MNNYQEYNLRMPYKVVSDKAFSPLCQGVIASLDGNAHFPNITPLLDELKVVVAEYIAAIPSRQDRSQSRTAIKEAKRDAAKVVLRSVGFHCQSVARDNYEALKSTGFPIAKTDQSKAPVEFESPIILSTHSNGTPNQLIVKCEADKAAKLYDVRTSTDEQNWTITTNDKSVVKVNNLPTDTTLYVQLRYRHGDEMTSWSEMTLTRLSGSKIATPMH